MKQPKISSIFAFTAMSIIFAVACKTMAHGEAIQSNGLLQDHPCNEKASRKMQERINAAVAEPKQLWTLVSSILCEVSTSTKRVETVYRHLSPFIIHTVEEIGELPSTTRTPRSHDLATEMVLASEVEYADLSAVSRNIIKLDYSSDICSRQITAELSVSNWQITNYVSSCD